MWKLQMSLPHLQATSGRRRRTGPVRLALLSAAIAALVQGPALAQSSEDMQALRAQLEQLRQEQAQRDQRIQQLEQSLLTLESRPAPAPVAAASTATTGSAVADRLSMTGDLRVRFQDEPASSQAIQRDSTQVRARLGAVYKASERIRIGARLVTGDADDPNSTDTQLSNFNDNLELSLDQAYVQLDLDSLQLFMGKFPQPFVRSDLVWDGDVMPQGLAGTWRKSVAGGTARANAMLFVIDEQAGGRDSMMAGGQLGWDSPRLGDWKFDITGGYYDYRLGNAAGADSGDFRTNLRKADGTYLSEFELVNAIGGVTWSGLGDRWPVRLGFDYVRNLGAATDADTGYAADITLGRASSVGDWRVNYAYMAAETDSVFTAFSHDNIAIGSNYKLHALTLDYVPSPKTMISGIWYHYRPLHAIDAGTRPADEWLDRFRLAFLVNF
jgi:hypothetical protein